jgi:hypothetical protein
MALACRGISVKQFFMAVILIIVPVAIFAAGYIYFQPHASASASVASRSPLGDLSMLRSIVTDVTAIAAAGDLAGAETRAADFEAAWNGARATIRPINPAAWAVVDGTASAALAALRATTPNPAKVTAALAGLIAALDNPSLTEIAVSGIGKVDGIAVTDTTGHAIPCETMLGAVRLALNSGKIAKANQASAMSFQSQAIDRCNAGDDPGADALSAQALALATN